MRSWDDIPEDQWISGTIDFRPGTDVWTIEFDWMGLNGQVYHHSPEPIDLEEFKYIYEELKALDYVFEIERTP